MKHLILATIIFFSMLSTAFALPRCEGTPILIDHPAYAKVLKFSGAAYDPDNNLIALSTEYMDQRPPNVRAFVFAHECGHSNLINTASHKLPSGNLQAELDADAYAVSMMKQKQIKLSDDDINVICNDVGPKRCEAIRKAFDEDS